MKIALISLFVLAFVCLSHCKDLIVGSSLNNQLILQKEVKVDAKPLRKQTEDVTFSDAGQQIIKGIVARDLDDTGAIVFIADGGVGSSQVTLSLRSERGRGLNYEIKIYG